MSAEELELTRTLSVGGHTYTTEVAVQEAPTDSDQAAIYLTQDAEEGNDAEPDVVVLTWGEWAEIADHVNLARGYMPDGSENQPSYCASASSRGHLCIVSRTQDHADHIDGDGRTWPNDAKSEPF